MNKRNSNGPCRRTAILVLSALALALPAFGSQVENANGYTTFSGTGTAQGTTNAFYVAGNYTINPATAVLKYANVTSDTGVLQFYVLTNMTTVVNPTNSGTTNFTVVSTNNFSTGQVLVIKHIASDTYEFQPLWQMTTTNLTTKYAPILQCAAGDQVWIAGLTGSISAVGTNLVLSQAGDWLYSGQYKLPMAISVTGTAKVAINAVSGNYQ